MGIIKKFQTYLPVSDKTPIVSLGEGNTPLVPTKNLIDILPGVELYFKVDGANPTGSFKDRGMTMAVSKAKEAGKTAVICASTGNTSAAAAAYSAAAGLTCYVVIPEGKVALGKLSQAMMYGAKIVTIKGNFDDALKLVCELSENSDIELVNSLNPFRIEGQKTAAFELCNDIGEFDIQCMPVGNAGNITAYWKGYKEFHGLGKLNSLPKMFGFQAAGSAPIVNNKVVEYPETIATAIRIGNPASWKGAVAARDESGGKIGAITDEKILEAYQLLASRVGIFAEPASCISLAGLIASYAEGSVPEGSRVVCILTGNGLKDPNCAIDVSTSSGNDVTHIENNIESMKREFGV